MSIVKVNLDKRSYEIVIKNRALAQAGQEIAPFARTRAVLIVTEPTVSDLYGKVVSDSLNKAGIEANFAEVPGGEECKTLESIEGIYERLLDIHMDRTGLILTLGGGVVGDMGGFAAATYLRGIDFIQIPTTLLAQVDASIGGKVGVDLPRGKNLVGAFHQPKRVLIDPEVLFTLPKRQFVSGLAEVIKHGIIADRDFFQFLRSKAAELKQLDRTVLETAITKSCEIKASVVTQDERESGLRAILNYGHTVGHGIETATGFAQYSHGEAVSIGMVTAAIISEKLGVAECGIADEITEILIGFDLPVVPNDSVDIESSVRAIAYDKKVISGKLRFVLPKSIGEAVIVESVSESDIRDAIDDQIRRYRI